MPRAGVAGAILGLAIGVLVGLAVAGRWEISLTAGGIVRIDRWTGQAWLARAAQAAPENLIWLPIGDAK